MTEPNPKPRKGSGQSQPSGQRPKGSGQPASGARQSTSPTGTPRAGRRQTTRYRAPEPTLMQKLRTPVLVLVVIAAIGLVAAFAITSATQTAYACSTIDTVQSPAPGELGQVQPDMGNQHVAVGDKVTYPVCPPASGKHINNPPRGPIPPRFYGPDDSAVPNGWVHNLEHAGIVVLYSCDKGACDQATQDQLKTIVTGLPNSPVCGTAPGVISPVVARFEQMPTKFAALVWGRVMYMDTLDIPTIFDFYTRYSERVEDGRFVAPPEPQCAVPSQSAAPSASPGASPAASSEASPAASPSAEPSAVPDTSAAPSPAAS